MTLSEIKESASTFTGRLDTLAESTNLECHDFATNITEYLKTSIVDRETFSDDPRFNDSYSFDTTTAFINDQLQILVNANIDAEETAACQALASDMVSALSEIRTLKGL
jgi:hypothetical protein